MTFLCQMRDGKNFNSADQSVAQLGNRVWATFTFLVSCNVLLLVLVRS